MLSKTISWFRRRHLKTRAAVAGMIVTFMFVVPVASAHAEDTGSSSEIGDLPVDVAATVQTRFEAVYLTNTGSKKNRTKAIQATMLAVDRWYAGQLGGKSPTLVGGANPTVLTIRNSKAANAITGGFDSNARRGIVNGWHESGLIPADVIPIIFVEGHRGDGDCGWTSKQYINDSTTPTDMHIVIPMDACRIYPSATTKFPNGATYLVAHELGHALGAEHSYANSRDLLYNGGSRKWTAIRISPTERRIISTSPALR